ncbi:MAG: primosomal protein N' [Chloroflexi bacterium]|nr:primosomal protein N' [Chloroflexota bacterium]MYF79026.1 primosomal protein N' [Chloroflexota bacterium]MYK61990.1 primosomal protein N' [Chloroflexota bacterium]
MFVEVAVDFSDRDRLRTYTYAVPEDLTVQPGDLLWVPFGYRPIQGIAISVSETCDTDNVREIDSVVDDGPFISQHLLETAIWIADYYRTNIFRACVAMLPPGANQQLHIWVSRGELADQADQVLTGFAISEEQREVLHELPITGRVRRDRLVGLIGRSKERHLDALVRNGIVVEESIWERPRASAVFKAHVKISEGVDVDKAVEQYQGRRAHRRVELVRHLASITNPLPRADLSKRFGNQVVRAVIDDGVAELMQVRVERDPLADYAVQDAISHELTPEQQDAVDAVSSSIGQPEAPSKGERFLLFGVTGSGKTEVYLRAVQTCIAEGKRAIIMVPEIAMTPQTLQRFASRFPGHIALQHSGLTIGQRFDQWHQIRNGRYNVVIGSRSSIFAPVENLGLVVIDEEHEWTFKQSDRAPRYHARDIADKLCELSGAALVLGSATPDIGTYRRSTDPDVSDPITLLQLPRRINEAINTTTRTGATDIETSGYAESRIVDMKLEIQAGHREMLSRPLLEALNDNVERGEKSILFINRRGSASFVQCLSCGTIRTCPNCETPLTLHRNPRQGRGSRLQCHYCSYSVGAARQCRNCDGAGVARRAAGTEGVEEAVRGFFPNTPILRWDSDTARNSTEHAKLLEEFQSIGNHILIGTQMVAKGLDIPTVSLVGVIAADIGLAVPSFRSAERTFQILSQVTGRAGRSDTPGVAIIQTFQPEHFAIAAAAEQDYAGFYEQEIATRQHFELPPFTSYVRLSYGAYDSNDAAMEARSVRTRIDQYLASESDAKVDVAGPSPSFPARRAGRYRWQILLKGDFPAAILDHVPIGPGWTVDVDPIEMN